MPDSDALNEFRARWLPHASDSGLVRITELLETASPYLIHGSFTRAVPMGCLASHLAWHHPLTCTVADEDAGIRWLSRIADLNPATSAVILAWDRAGLSDSEFRHQLLAACRAELTRRSEGHSAQIDQELCTC